MWRAVGIACIGIGSGLLAPEAQAQGAAGARALSAAFGACGEPCVIRYSPGGEVTTFQAAAKAVKAGARRQVVIDGPCYSACAIFADLARARVCITDRAQFGFHKATLLAVYSKRDGSTSRVEFLGRRDPPHSRDIAGWVRRNGGFPTSGFRTMTSAQASRFWKRCSA